MTRGRARTEEEDRWLLLLASRHDEFSYETIWKASHASYQWVARTLRQWWMEGLTLRKAKDGSWHPYSPAFDEPFVRAVWTHEAIFRWIE